MKDNIVIKNLKNRTFSLITCIAFSLLLIFTAQILLSHSNATIVLAGSGPSIYFPEDSWDFGEITPDELPIHIFKFENIGNEILIIKEAKVSCESCIDPIISAGELNPGEEGELKITVNSLDMMGRFTKRIYVESNDPANPRAVITVSGFIKEKNESAVQNQPQTKPQVQPNPQTPFRVGMSYFGLQRATIIWDNVTCKKALSNIIIKIFLKLTVFIERLTKYPKSKSSLNTKKLSKTIRKI